MEFYNTITFKNNITAGYLYGKFTFYVSLKLMVFH